jgi:hypothetical protein
MADICAQILIDGTDVLSTNEEEVEELRAQGIVAYTLENWEPTGYFYRCFKGSRAKDWQYVKFVMSLYMYFAGLELTQVFLFAVIFNKLFAGDGAKKSADFANNAAVNVIIVLVLTVFVNYQARKMDKIEELIEKCREIDVESMPFDQFQIIMEKDYRTIEPTLVPCGCCGYHRPTGQCRTIACGSKRPPLELGDQKFVVRELKRMKWGMCGATVALLLTIAMTYVISHYFTLAMSNVATAPEDTPYGDPWMLVPGTKNVRNDCGGSTSFYQKYTIQNGAYGWCSSKFVSKDYFACAGTSDSPFKSSDYPPKGINTADISHDIAQKCLDHNPGNSWDSVCYLPCTTDADCPGAASASTALASTPHQMSCQPMWWGSPAGSSACGSACVFPNVSSTLPPPPSGGNPTACQPLGRNCAADVTSLGSFFGNFAISMCIAWGQGLVTVIVLFFFRLYCCSREGKEARSKLIGGGDGGEGGAYGATATTTTNPYD